MAGIMKMHTKSVEGQQKGNDHVCMEDEDVGMSGHMNLAG